MNSYAWRGPRGSGKRTLLLQHLAAQASTLGLPFTLKEGTWFLSKPSGGTNADPDDDDAGDAGKSIPYEESALHIGFDVARMSMSDKLFLQTILPRWTGQQDVTLLGSGLSTRYLVLYHAHYLTDESVLQLQEALEQCANLGILLTTELPVCLRLRDFCLDIPVSAERSAVAPSVTASGAAPGPPLGSRSGAAPGGSASAEGGSADAEADRLLATYVQKAKLPATDVWRTFFRETAEAWSKPWSPQRVQEIRDWIYICLQRNLRWTDMIAYWMETIHGLDHLDIETKRGLYRILAEAEAGGGWMLVPSYRIPILWEAVQAKLARAFLAAAHPSSPA